MTLTADEIRRRAAAGVLFFPVTPMDEGNQTDLVEFRQQLEASLAYAPGGVFVGCGTGEFYALVPDEYERLVAAATEVVAGAVPVVAGAGYGPGLCLEFVRRAESAGADAVLVFPPPGPVGGRAGILAHYSTVASASPLPLILYQRDQVAFDCATVTELLGLDRIIGLKDGQGDLERVQRLRITTGDRWAYFNGLPTAELTYRAYAAVGVDAYSSAVFSFLPEVAVAFHRSVHSGDAELAERLLREFYQHFAELRDAHPGYPVSLIKAGARLRGRPVGPVRPPLVDPTPEHTSRLSELIARGLALVGTEPGGPSSAHP